MGATGLQHVSIAVPAERLAETERFYADVLGMVPIAGPGAARWLAFGDGHHVHLLDRPGPAAAGAPGSGPHFAVEVADLDATLRRARGAGSAARAAASRWGAPRAYLRDPAGNDVEVFETSPPRPLHAAVPAADPAALADAVVAALGGGEPRGAARRARLAEGICEVEPGAGEVRLRLLPATPGGGRALRAEVERRLGTVAGAAAARWEEPLAANARDADATR